MSEKNYTPEEAARMVLEKCQEMYNSQKIEKAERDSKGKPTGEYSRGGMGVDRGVQTAIHLPVNHPKSGQSVSGHYSEKAKDAPNSGLRQSNKKKAVAGHKQILSELKEQKAPNLPKSEDSIKKVGGGAATTGQGGGSLPGSVATTGAPSIASQIGFGKSDEEEMHPKLKSFIEKRKAKKAAKMEKMMGIGEKAPIAAPAQSAAPINAPKPSAGSQAGSAGPAPIKKTEKK
jgi:hypothetical protein